jgi:hypothetical protein
MRIIEVALRYSTLGYGIPLSISSLFLRREYGRVQRRAAEKRRNQTSNLGVGGSNPSERANDFNDLGKRDTGDASQKCGLGSAWEAPARFLRLL